MYKGYYYSRDVCPSCEKIVADNWYIRHVKACEQLDKEKGEPNHVDTRPTS